MAETKLHLIESSNPHASDQPLLVALPGGPGLSSTSLRGLEILAKDFTLAFADPPGTGSAGTLADLSFGAITQDIAQALQQVGRPLILVAHSFGAAYAMEMASILQRETLGAILIAPVITSLALDALDQNYTAQRSQVVASMHRRFDEEPSRLSFNAWLASYGTLFFSERNLVVGSEILRGDLSSPETFVRLRASWKPSTEYEARIKRLRIPKLFVSAERDPLVPRALVERQASELGGACIMIPGSAHFAHLDEPEIIRENTKRFVTSLSNKEVVVQ